SAAGRARSGVRRPGSRLGAMVQRLCLQALLPVPTLVQQCTSFLHVYQVSGLQQFLRTTGVLRHLAPMLATMEMLLPRVPARAERRPVPIETPPVGVEQGRVGSLTGGIIPCFLP